MKEGKQKKRRDLICVWRDTSFAKSYILTYIPLISHPYGTPSNYVDVYDRYIATTNGGVGAFFANKKKQKRQPHLFRVDNGGARGKRDAVAGDLGLGLNLPPLIRLQNQHRSPSFDHLA